MAENWTAIVSRARGADAQARALEAALVEQAGACGLDVLVVPHLYDLRDDHPAAEALRAIAGPAVVFAWAYPRATFWTLDDLGVHGVRADLEKSPGRAVFPIDLRGLASADAAFEPLRARGLSATGRAGTVREIAAPAAERWYPVIDYARCVNCLDCAEFCLFGVYEPDDAGRPVVRAPDQCRWGCPACSRVCPGRAIMFPHHEGSPAIAGADTGEIEPLSRETAAADALAADCAEAVEQHLASRPCKCRPDRPCEHPDAAECPADCVCDCHTADPFDRAIDELDSDKA
jgi:NAD-dependent dihydropyrimidine dehydrogenase PreA subunit